MLMTFAVLSDTSLSDLERSNVEGEIPVNEGRMDCVIDWSTWPWQWLGKMGESSLQG